jgi:hypothetical protein
MDVMGDVGCEIAKNAFGKYISGLPEIGIQVTTPVCHDHNICFGSPPEVE